MSQAKPAAPVESKSAEPNAADELRAAHAELEAKSAALTQAKVDAEGSAAAANALRDELEKERDAHAQTRTFLQAQKKQTAELFELLEDAKQRIGQLHTQRGPLDPHAATAVTSSPAFEDLPEDHPLKQ